MAFFDSQMQSDFAASLLVELLMKLVSSEVAFYAQIT